MNKYYEQNKSYYKDKASDRRKAIKEFLIEYKESTPCHDCGASYPHYVMDLDHRPGSEKTCNPSQLANTGSWKRVHAELEMCDVVCANCHRFRTHRRGYQNQHGSSPA